MDLTVGVYFVSRGPTHPRFHLSLPAIFNFNGNVDRDLASILHVPSLSFEPDLLWCPDCKKNYRYNKYTQIAARAVRQSLKEDERLVAEKRGLTALRYQHWENGKGGEQVAFSSPVAVQ